MKIIGVSGGSGAGKSTVSRGLAKVLPNSLFIDVDPFFREVTDELEEKIFKRINVKKEDNVLNYNYFFESLEAMNVWIDVIKDKVSQKIEEAVEMESKNKDYIIVDWCYLPMCDYFEKCDYTLCVKADEKLRYTRLSNRMKAIDGYSIEKGPSFWEYKQSSFENRVKFSAINDYGYKSQYEIVNGGTLEDLQNSIEEFASFVMNDEDNFMKVAECKK